MLKNYKLTWILLFSVVVISLTIVLTPVFLVHPFKAQTNEMLSISYSLRNWAYLITFLALLGGLLLQYSLWNRTKRLLGKLLIILMIFPLLASSWFARENHFEWMFAPLLNATYVKISQVDFIEEEDMVMAVELNGEAAAYPIRQLAYHHIVQDTLGGIPIVITY